LDPFVGIANQSRSTVAIQGEESVRVAIYEDCVLADWPREYCSD
jgi:hypothetical protein